MMFSELPLSAMLQQKLAAANFTTPTPVQAEAIPTALEGRDLLATAQTGTGKTLAFLIPIIEHLLKSNTRHVEALILLPTRELAMQVADEYDKIRGRKLPAAALVIGGVPEKRQLAALRGGARLTVATPGRLEDFLSRRLVDLTHVQMLVLDEADRMLDMGFLPAIRRIVAALPKQRQTMLFSATLEASIVGLVKDYLKDPKRIALGSTLKPAATVDLFAYEVNAMKKADTLRAILYEEEGSTLVFARTKRGTERLAKNLVRDGFSATMIHGDRTQSQRVKALQGFDEGRYQILVATDIAARGIDIDSISHVVNYDLPALAEDFIHRVGRTGRAGQHGKASSIVSGAEVIDLHRIEKTLKLRIERRKIGEEAARRTSVSHNTLPSRTLSRLPGEVFA
jgi:ATP-dependent RNA helicase RhlE